MHRAAKIVLGVVAGVLAGSLVNGGIIGLSAHVIPPPPGTDVSTMEGLKAALPLFEPRQFIFPFLAHTLGSFVGAFVGSLVAGPGERLTAIILGVLFLLGGITAVAMLPAPMWFNATDLLLAYLPMAWLGWKAAGALRRSPAA